MAVGGAGAGDWHNGFQLFRLGEDHEKFQWIKEYMNKTVGRKHYGQGDKIKGYHILEVHLVKNAYLWKKYSERRELLYQQTGEWVAEKRLFHGTDQAERIARHGFNVGLAKDTGMFGKALYFADLSSKSNQYSFKEIHGGCAPHRDVSCDQCVRSMLLCRVALGYEHHSRVALNGITGPEDGFHCVIGDPGKDLQYREYAIYDNHQAYPGHLIKYKVIK